MHAYQQRCVGINDYGHPSCRDENLGRVEMTAGVRGRRFTADLTYFGKLEILILAPPLQDGLASESFTPYTQNVLSPRSNWGRDAFTFPGKGLSPDLAKVNLQSAPAGLGRMPPVSVGRQDAGYFHSPCSVLLPHHRGADVLCALLCARAWGTKRTGTRRLP